jgi:hypothetical protein
MLWFRRRSSARASANVHSEAQRSGEVQELNTAAIIHGEESVATLHYFRAAGIRHNRATGSDDVTATLDGRRVRDGSGESAAADG